jgi:hypothetical protein
VIVPERSVTVTVWVLVVVLDTRIVSFLGRSLKLPLCEITEGTHKRQGVTVYRRNDEQSARADDEYGRAEVALTARRQLSALQVDLLTRSSGAAQTLKASWASSKMVAERILGSSEVMSP